MNSVDSARKKTSSSLPTDLVLSVRQPYAQLLCTASKQNERVPRKWIENRTWEPTGIENGKPTPILIHASNTPDHPDWYTDYGLSIDDCAHGAIIGYTTLIGWKCLRLHKSDKMSKTNNKVWAEHCKQLQWEMYKHTDYFVSFGFKHVARERGMYHWMFADPVLFDRPIPCKGQLRLWRYEK